MENTKNYTRVIAGTMTWGTWGKNLAAKEMVDLMHYCISTGITTFDHADIYGDYGNETDFGKALADSAIDRSEIQLISKCGIQMLRGRNNKVKHYQYDADYIIGSAEQSLKKLQTEYLDLFLLHRPSPLMHPSEIAKAITTLKDSGKIKEFGVSNFTPSQIALLETEIAVTANQVEFSLTHTDPMYDGTFDDCLSKKRTAMAWSPLGTYFREDDDSTARIKTAFESMAPKYGVEAYQLLLAFIMKHPANVIPVVGTAQKERLKGSLDATALELELEDWFVLLEASHGKKVP